MRSWCLGFVFTKTLDSVLLLRKGRTLHVGLWNGVGGNLLPNESPRDAMVRECHEETQIKVYDPFWVEVGDIIGPSWKVVVFATWIDPIDPGRFPTILEDTPATLNDSPVWVGLATAYRLKLAPHADVLIQEAARQLHAEREKMVRTPIQIHESTTA